MLASGGGRCFNEGMDGLTPLAHYPAGLHIVGLAVWFHFQKFYSVSVWECV